MHILHLVIRSSYGNYGDFFPALRWLDVQDMEAGFLEAKTQLRKSITALIEKKKQETSMFSAEEIQSGAHERDIMSKFLSVQGEDRFSEEQLVFVVYMAPDRRHRLGLQGHHGSNTQNPAVYKRALHELDTVIGTTTRLVEDADIPKLPSIHNIVKETLRLHPPAPTFPPHRNLQPCEVGGYLIPADCSIVINLPPIMRDPTF